jgi:hypothetical protein
LNKKYLFSCSCYKSLAVGFKNEQLANQNGKHQEFANFWIPRWWLEGGSRKQASYGEILERRWRLTLQA